MNLDDYLIDTEKQALIKNALLQTYFKDKNEDFLKSEYGKIDIEANVNQRYLRSLNNIVPWVSNYIDLQEKILLEIGCGTGSSTVAFSHFVQSIIAYDIDKRSIDAAKKRSRILDISNIKYHLVSPDNLLESIALNSREKNIDIILLFAVLEHMTVAERHDTINFCWDLLSDDGLLVIVETPNLLQYFDSHTSVLPFFHMLPSDLCARYSVNSPRDGFNDYFFEDENLIDLDVKMSRWGRGVSYHDFELTIGDEYAKYIIANGYEKEILEWFGVTLEEDILRFYIDNKKYKINNAFKRSVLNLILKKLFSRNLLRY